jgi:hypothetical protein
MPDNTEEKPLPLEKIQLVAKEALASLGNLVGKENYEIMGFKSLAELKTTTLGEPLRVFMVRLDQLKEYQPGSDPNKLLSSGDQVIYPVMVDKMVRSSVVIGMAKDTWKPVSLGRSNLAQLLTKVLKDNAKSAKLPVSSYFVVHVPALNLYFVAHRVDKVLTLIPVLDDPSYGFKAGKAIIADKVFEAILPAARKHDGLPG